MICISLLSYRSCTYITLVFARKAPVFSLSEDWLTDRGLPRHTTPDSGKCDETGTLSPSRHQREIFWDIWWLNVNSSHIWRISCNKVTAPLQQYLPTTNIYFLLACCVMVLLLTYSAIETTFTRHLPKRTIPFNWRSCRGEPSSLENRSWQKSLSKLVSEKH